MEVFCSHFFWFALRLAQLLFTLLVLCFSAFGKKTLDTSNPVKTKTNILNIVINWWNENWSSNAPVSISALLFCSLITPFSLAYLLLVPVWFGDSKLNHSALITAIEGTMALVWALSSISTAVMTGQRVCFGTVCGIAKAAIAMGILQW